MPYRNNNTTKAIGECGKSLVCSLFRQKGFQVTKPLTDPEDYIDFFAYRNGELLKAFVRTDTRVSSTGNIVIERFMHRKDTIENGWLFKGKADMLCYLDACEGNVYFFDWKMLKAFVVATYQPHPFRNPYDQASIGDAYVVPLRHLVREKGVFLDRSKVDITPMYKINFPRPAPF